MNPEVRLRELGLELPEAPKPVAEYVLARRVGDLVYVSGQGSTGAGRAVHAGRDSAAVPLEIRLPRSQTFRSKTSWRPAKAGGWFVKQRRRIRHLSSGIECCLADHCQLHKEGGE